MTTLREAAQQALEALQKIYLAPEHDEYIRVWWPACDEAITALRAALEQPEQEPVAWGMMLDGKIYDCITPEEHDRKEGKYTIPLYTQPQPKAEPLTEEEIIDAVRGADLDWAYGWTLEEERNNRFVAFTRAIERAHGIGGSDE